MIGDDMFGFVPFEQMLSALFVINTHPAHEKSGFQIAVLPQRI